jgi:hypothetical protein
MKAGMRISIKDYRLNKNPKVLVLRSERVVSDNQLKPQPPKTTVERTACV